MLTSLAMALALGAGASCAVVTPEQDTGCVEIVSLQRPMFGSGIFAVHAPVEVRDAEGRETMLYIIYMGEEQVLPTPGQRCRFHYRLDRVSGSLGAPAGDAPYPLITDFACDCP